MAGKRKMFGMHPIWSRVEILPLEQHQAVALEIKSHVDQIRGLNLEWQETLVLEPLAKMVTRYLTVSMKVVR